MQLQAASLGQAVPHENFDALIQSVFDSAVNLRLAEADRLITVLVSDHYELPQGIRIPTRDLPLRSLTLSTTLRASLGLHAASRCGILRFDASPLTVDLRGASIWRCRIPELDLDMESLASQRACAITWDLLNREQRDKNADIIADELLQANTGSPLSRRIGQPLMELVASAEQFDAQGAVRAAKKMIGLGQGVTPSGDDILIGFLAGLWSMAGQDQTQISFIRSFSTGLIKLAKKTGEISRTYIFHAAQGQFSSSLSHLAEAIATGGDVEAAAQTSMRVGHSSGMDSVTGLLIGLCVWNTQKTKEVI
jgi:hypothetical protein